MVAHQNSCSSITNGCQFNAKLLQYFIQKEFVEKKEEELPLQEEPLESKEETLEEIQPEEPSHCCDHGDEIQKANVMTITKCPHTLRKHYAKNMCSSCYRKFGRN